LEQLQGPISRVTGFSEQTIELFKRHSWPGNIRELRNAVEHGLAMASAKTIAPIDLPAALQRASLDAAATSESRGAPFGSRADALEAAERDYLIALLRENAGNVARSANQAGMSRQGLHKLLKKHAVDAGDYRG
jgi:DNA-binding NtrC family response regulator